MKNVLVTGSEGFIGRCLTQKLQNIGCRVIQFNRRQKKDILNPASFKDIGKPDTIFHLAGVVGYLDASKSLENTYRTNVLGTINVLNFCRKTKAKLIFPSTFVYGPPFAKSKKETDLPAPANFYTHSKYIAELFCQTYAEKYRSAVVIARASNAYGPDQPSHYIIPYLIQDFLKNKEIKINNPASERDYIYIDDLVSGLIKLARANTKPGEIFNLCSGNSIKLIDLVEIIKELTCSKSEIIFEKKLRKNEVLKSLVDNSKIKKIGWRPEISLKQGLLLTINSSKKTADR